jgi:hypothetical protein
LQYAKFSWDFLPCGAAKSLAQTASPAYEHSFLTNQTEGGYAELYPERH